MCTELKINVLCKVLPLLRCSSVREGSLIVGYWAPDFKPIQEYIQGVEEQKEIVIDGTQFPVKDTYNCNIYIFESVCYT